MEGGYLTGRNWTRENIAWLAGLLEGEGSFLFHRGKSLVISMAMTDEDVVRRAQQIACIGGVYGPYVRGEFKPQWVFRCTDSATSYALMVAILPWLGTRRRETVCQLIDGWKDWMAVGRPAAYRRVGLANRKVTDEMRTRIDQEYNGVRWGHGQLRALADELGLGKKTIYNVSRGRQ